MGVFFPMGRLSYVYVFGGRGEDDETLTHCEKYSIYERKLLITQENGSKSRQWKFLVQLGFL